MGRFATRAVLSLLGFAVGCQHPDVDPDLCRGVDCSGHGECQVIQGRAVCQCDDGYTVQGLECLPVSDPCASLSCLHGTCRVGTPGAVCECETGYAGAACDQCASGYHWENALCRPDAPDPCSPNPCQELHRTVCRANGTSFFCDCEEGYHDEGGACVLNATGPCAPNPCRDTHRTVCIPDGSDFSCACDGGYQDNDGDGTCLANCFTAGLVCPPNHVCDDSSGTAVCVAGEKPPIYIAFQWHMHQPIYWPYESVVVSEQSARMPFSLYQVHLDRSGPYTSWPRDAIDACRSLPYCGAQVSFSGSLMENLGALAAAGVGFSGWTGPWREAAAWTTARGNPRLAFVAFGYHHPLMGLVGPGDIRLQAALHRLSLQRAFQAAPARGMFPPECAFSERMIPALVAEGIEWVMVDNIHFDRAHRDYPYSPASNLPPPNPAEQINRAATGWVQLRDLWAPSPVSAPWGYQPHWVEWTDPDSGQKTRIVAVPAARYEGNEDARGGFGALQYEKVLSQLEPYNLDPAHPMLVLLHHDGDNYGAGTESYYHGNFQAFVAWAAANPHRFVPTTVQDYLDRFPPAPNDVIHVEDGAWSGADNGDAEFSKWNGAPDAEGYSPDRNSWAVVVAAENRVRTAESLSPHASIENILDGAGSDTERAWHYFLNAETSCYWYWDNSLGGLWDSHPTRAANLAVEYADRVIGGGGADTVGPTLYLPQRWPFNPGRDGATADVEIWTLAYDASGLAEVTLLWRRDADGQRRGENDLYAGGSFSELPMQEAPLPAPRTDPLPRYRAERYTATIAGQRGALIDYYVRGSDRRGNVTRSPIQHVWIGNGSSSGGNWTPEHPTRADVITIEWERPARLHWGVDASLNGGVWSPPPAEYWPAGSTLWSDGKAIESPLSGPNGSGRYAIDIGPFNQTEVREINFVFHNDDGSWSRPDQTIPISPGTRVSR